MAILSKIRERTFILILIIGMALFAFVIGDAINKNGGPTRMDVVGEINGEEISREEFSQILEVYKSRSNSSISDIQTLNAVWDGFVRERVFKEQLELAGIVVGENDVWENLISNPNFQSDPSFQNEVGLFDEEKVKEYIANMREDAIGALKGSDEKARWDSWLSYEGRVRQGVVQTSYTSLVNAGLGATLEEGKRDYLFNNTNITSQYVYLPYASVADSLITITNKDYQNYINEHKKEFEVDESRDLKYVKFTVVASKKDKDALKEELDGYIEEFKSAENNANFVDDVNSDTALNTNFSYSSQLPKDQVDAMMNANVGDVVGTYEDAGYYKISKVEAVKQLPDSVSASHILISYLGSQSAGPDTKQTEVEAKKTADSLLTVLKSNGSKFDAIAKEFSVDKSNSDKGGKLDWYTRNAMVPEFGDYTFLNKKGDMDIVKTAFGFHIVKITDQKNIQKTVKLATVSRKIEASEETEAQFYQNAEIFASKLTEGADFNALSQENNYVPLPANGVKALAENVPGLQGNNRNIVRWAFEEDTEVNDVRRFDVDNGFVVAVLSSKTKEGTATVNNVASRIKPILIRKKKAEILNKKLNGATLEDIANASSVSIKTATNVNLASPTISGVGNEPAIVGAMSTAAEGKVIVGLEGVKGVFAIKVTSKELPTELDNYDVFRNRIATKYKGRSSQLYTALKETSEIKDYRASIY
ncbi:MAG: peptidylprolyl isomerase [Urechidicola sp.]|nr:peptidylprolyl isomerase [Urechidicola sp.]